MGFLIQMKSRNTYFDDRLRHLGSWQTFPPETKERQLITTQTLYKGRNSSECGFTCDTYSQ